jgi:lipoyl(octanoyl) transferase
VPCGIRGRGVTSIERALGRPVPLEAVMDRLTEHFTALFGLEVAPSHPR